MEIKEHGWTRASESERLEITKELFSADVPWGLYNVVPDSFRNALALVDPRWMSHKEETVTKHADPTDRDENFRLAFWTEYNTCKDLDKPFSIHRVMSGVCSPYYYKHTILKTPRLVAYIVYPPTDYMNFMKNMLYKGQQRMKEIMSVSAINEVTETDKDGKETTKKVLDMKLANMQLKTFALLDNRVKGAIVQRVKVEQKNLNVNVSAAQLADASPTSVIDIDKQLTQIDRELNRNDEIMNNRRALELHSSQPIGEKAVQLEVDSNPEKGKKH